MVTEGLNNNNDNLCCVEKLQFGYLFSGPSKIVNGRGVSGILIPLDGQNNWGSGSTAALAVIRS